MFAKSLPMPLVVGARKRLEILRTQPRHKENLWKIATALQKGLKEAGFDLGEKNSDGPRLSKKFKLTAYPSLYFLDQNENIVHFSLGYQKPAQLLELGKTALSK